MLQFSFSVIEEAEVHLASKINITKIKKAGYGITYTYMLALKDEVLRAN